MKGEVPDLTASCHGLTLRSAERILRGWDLSPDGRSYTRVYRGVELRVEPDGNGYRPYVDGHRRMFCDNPLEAMKFAHAIVQQGVHQGRGYRKPVFFEEDYDNGDEEDEAPDGEGERRSA